MLKNVLSNWTGTFVAGVCSVLVTPVMIHRLGVVYYGMWILAASLLDYYGLLDVAMRMALFRFVARFKGANQREALADTISTAITIAAVTGLGLLVLTPVLAAALPRFFSVGSSNVGLFRGLLILVGTSLAITIPARVLGSYLCGLGRFDLFNVSGIASVCVRTILIVLLLERGHGIMAIAAISPLIALLSLVLNWRLFRHAEPGIPLTFRDANWTRAKELAHYGTYAFVNMSGESLRSYTDAVVIARVLTIALVASFNVATRLMDYFNYVMSAIGAPLLAAMSEIVGHARPAELNEFYLKSTRYMLLISMFIGSLFLLDGKTLIRLWVGPAFLPSYALVLILVAGYVLNFGLSPTQIAAFALARHRPLAFLTLAEGLANLLLSIHWAHQYGLVGVALGTTVPLMISKTCIQPWYVLHILQLSGRRYLNEALLRPVLACGGYLAICESRLAISANGGLVDLASVVALQAALFAVLAFSVGLLPSDREFLWQRSKQAVLGLRLVRAD